MGGRVVTCVLTTVDSNIHYRKYFWSITSPCLLLRIPVMPPSSLAAVHVLTEVMKQAAISQFTRAFLYAFLLCKAQIHAKLQRCLLQLNMQLKDPRAVFYEHN